jgi:putative toxin-antitoxin system antitoxin component (TIGR02293 family)
MTADVIKDDKDTGYSIPEIVSQVALLTSQEAALEELRWELLGGKLLSPTMPGSDLEFYDFVTTGIPRLSVDILAAVMDVPMTKMADLLNLSYKTLTRKDKKDLLDPVVSSHTYEMSNVIAKGLEVFEDIDKLRRWLQKENRTLQGRKPFDLLNTPTGIKLVNQILGRLEEGIYS